MNFSEESARNQLVRLIQTNYRPWLPVGQDVTHRNIGYRIVPEAFGLQANHDRSDGRSLLHINVLGVNTDNNPVWPPDRRDEARNGEPTRTTESDEVDENGFPFHQFGKLQYCEVEGQEYRKRYPTPVAADEAEWEDTGFFTVIRISSFGRQNGIYAIFDWFPITRDDGTGEEWRFRVHTKDGRWGILPGHQTPISVAKIADSVDDLVHENDMSLRECVDKTVEIVRTYFNPARNAICRAVRPEAL